MIKAKSIWTFTTFIGCLLIWTSCNYTDDILLFDYNDSFSLTCTKSYWANTRTSIDESGNSNFSENDKIEIQINSEDKIKNAQLEYIAGKWNPSINRKEYGNKPLTLSALFPILPHTNGDETVRDLILPTDQSNIVHYVGSDILFAKTTLDNNDASATLQFNHALHRIYIQLKGTIPNDLKVEVRSRIEGKISINDGTVTLNDNSLYSWMNPLKLNDTTYMVRILPQNANPYQKDEGLLRLTSNGKTVSYHLNSEIGTFYPSMQTTLNLTLKKAEGNIIDTEFCNQTRWVYGITSPAFPGKENLHSEPSWQKNVEEGIWFRYNYDNMSIPLPYENQYLTWKEGCGWFDCNKSFLYEGDGNMCWAAAASNLIHWWMAQNKEYIAAYDKKFGHEYEDLERPEKYTKMTSYNQQHSEVFNFFKSSFGNQGSWDTGGVNWFINGNDKNLIYCHRPNFHGFFSHVFPKETDIATETRDTSKENFNLWIKDAFRHNRAICFTAFDFAGPGTKRHSMVIWGVEFDAEGIVANVYFCDNNYGEDEPNHASLRRYKVEYYPSDVPEHQGEEYAYLVPLDNNDGTKAPGSEFTSLTLVDLRHDIWQKAFPEITIDN